MRYIILPWGKLLTYDFRKQTIVNACCIHCVLTTLGIMSSSAHL